MIKKKIKKQENNPYSKKSFIKNFCYVLCGPMQPATINYRELVNKNYFNSMEETYTRLKQEMTKDDTLIAIPGSRLYDEIKLRALNNNDKFILEYKIINSPGFIAEQLNRNKDELEQQDITENGYEKETYDFRLSSLVKFCIEGYEETKRYVCLKNSPNDDIEKYWKFIWDYEISNVVMLFSKVEEEEYSLKWNLPRDTIIVNNEFIVKYDHGYRYTNFTINIYLLYAKNDSTGEPRRLNIYRFWLYDISNNVPVFSKYFVKLIRIINFNNPVHTKFFKKKKKFQIVTNYPRQYDTNSMTNYLIHSSDISRIYSFILYDYICDEFRYTNHFAMDVVLKKLHNYAPTDTRLLPINLKQHMFSYYSAFEYVISPSNDVALDEMEGQIKFITKLSVTNKKTVVSDQFDVSVILFLYYDYLRYI